MGDNESPRPSRGADRRTPHLPRYIIEHIGQVLRNRSREDLLVPVPGEMLKMLERAERGSTVVPGLGRVDGQDPPVCR
jgi:hypothetical protein